MSILKIKWARKELSYRLQCLSWIQKLKQSACLCRWSCLSAKAWRRKRWESTSRLSGVLKQGICSIALGVSELMVGEAPAPRGLKSPAIHHDVSPCPLGFCMQCPPLPMLSFSMSVLATSTVFSGPEGWLWPYCMEARPICMKQTGLWV